MRQDGMARDTDEYPLAIQRAGKSAMAIFDRVEEGLLADGYPQHVVDMMIGMDLDAILAQAKLEPSRRKPRGNATRK